MANIDVHLEHMIALSNDPEHDEFPFLLSVMDNWNLKELMG
jgi:hypothetical protein